MSQPYRRFSERYAEAGPDPLGILPQDLARLIRERDAAYAALRDVLEKIRLRAPDLYDTLGDAQALIEQWRRVAGQDRS